MNHEKMPPLVTVIVPVYNVERYLARCLDSIVNQTYQNIEIILVNDGSTDTSGEICQRYAQNDSRIRIFTQENQGLSAARNTGLDHMNGEYIVFIDSDDYVSIYFVEIMLNKLLEYDVKIAICDRLEVDDADDTADIDHVSLQDIGSCVKMSRDDIFERVYQFGGKIIVVWEKIYHRKIFESLRFERGRIHEDSFIFHKIYAQVDEVCWIAQALYVCRMSTNSITRTGGVYHPHRDNIDALLERLAFFQQYGDARYIKATVKRISQILLSFVDQMKDSELREFITQTGQEIYRITGLKSISVKCKLFKGAPKMYRFAIKCYRAARHMLAQNERWYVQIKKILKKN